MGLTKTILKLSLPWENHIFCKTELLPERGRFRRHKIYIGDVNQKLESICDYIWSEICDGVLCEAAERLESAEDVRLHLAKWY